MKASPLVRPCAVCGLFYPDDAAELRTEVGSLLERVGRVGKGGGRIRGVIAPHAGYMYSGYTAAHAYAFLKGQKYNVVVIISPSHQEYFDGISVFPGDAYSTPLGTVNVHNDLREKLLKNSSIVMASKKGHGSEHAIEVQLPFLQQALQEYTILPIVMGDQRRELCFHLGDVLSTILEGENHLLVASTDLSHYYPSEIANRLDSRMIEDIALFDQERLMEDLETGKTEACGGGPTVAIMTALGRLGVSTMEVLHHCNSGDITGDRHRVVGYVSAVARESTGRQP